MVKIGLRQDTRPTMGLLPESIDHWRHGRRWRRKSLARFRQADVLVVCHAKSGQTWLRTMISHLYHLKYGVPAKELIKFDNFHSYSADIPKIYITKDTRHSGKAGPGGGEFISSDKKVVFLVRDPRDTAVSFYFHVQGRATGRELARKSIPVDARTLSISEFVMDDRFGLPNIIALMNRWEREIQDLPNALLIRYEEMHAAPQDLLHRVMDFIGDQFTAEQFDQAVEFASFDSLKEKEREGFFDGERLRPGDAANPDTYKVRRGRIGGYTDYFTAGQLAEIDLMVHETLLSFYGY
jgi:hypothetical protein